MAFSTLNQITVDQFFGIVPIDEDLAPTDGFNPTQEITTEIAAVEGKRPDYIYEMWKEREGDNPV